MKWRKSCKTKPHKRREANLYRGGRASRYWKSRSMRSRREATGTPPSRTLPRRLMSARALSTITSIPERNCWVQIWSALLEELFEYRKKRVERQKTAQAMLRTYAKAHFEFLKVNFNKFIALFTMGIDLNPADNKTHPWSREINKRVLAICPASWNTASKMGNSVLSRCQGGAYHPGGFGWVDPAVGGDTGSGGF